VSVPGWRASSPEVLRTVTVGGRTLRVSIRRGDGSLPPLLLMNGIGASLEVLQPFVDALDPRREVIRFDVPGVGGSPRPVMPYTMITFAPVVAGLLTEVGHPGAVDVLGFSWGGGLAQQFAVQHRKRCRRLVLAATGTGTVMVPASPRVLARMLTPRRHRDPGYTRRIAGEIYGGTMRAHPSGPQRRCTPPRGSARSAATTTNWPPGPAGRACRCCGSSGSPPWWWPVTTTRSSRRSTRGSWRG
jgi:pimeloyl-ACP methyl ester carboxylesterase